MIEHLIHTALGHDIELKTSSYASVKGRLTAIYDGWAVIEKKGETHTVGFYRTSVHVIHRPRHCQRCKEQAS